MSVRSKIFLAFVSFIVTMGLLFAFLTVFVVSGILQHMLDIDREAEIRQVADQVVRYYEDNGHSWTGIERHGIRIEQSAHYPGAGYMLLSPDHRMIAVDGDVDHRFIRHLGIRQPVQFQGETIAQLFYYDDEVGNIAKLRTGINSSVTFLLLAVAFILVLSALLVAFWLSGRLTAPLRRLIPAIDRLADGELGVQVEATGQDEYGKVTRSFNAMSSQLQRAEELRSHLVADVAHELRTPITIIRGKLEMLQHQGSPVQPETLLPVQDELIRLTRLVDDLHQLSLAEANKLQLDIRTIDMRDLMTRLIEHLEEAASHKNIRLAFHCHTERSTLHADPHRMTQVFLNLLSNAVRYTPEDGMITVSMRHEVDRKTEQEWLLTIVSDNGIGIDPEHLPYVFERFYRTDNARAREQGGTGLGLAIAKEYVLAHRGRIEVASRPGQGTNFIVSLPLDPVRT